VLVSLLVLLGLMSAPGRWMQDGRRMHCAPTGISPMVAQSPANPVWPEIEGEAWPDMSGHGGVAEFWGLEFDGDDYVSIPSSPSFAVDSTDDFLVQAWANHDESGTHDIMVGGRVGDDGFEISINSSNQGYCEFRVAGSGVYYTGTSTMPTGWNYHEMYVSRADAKLYYQINGVDIKTPANCAAAIAPSAHPIAVGAQSRDGNMINHFGGDLVGVRMWIGTIPTPEQRAAWKYVSRLGPMPSLVFEYPMLPGYGQSVLDASGNGHHGQRGSTSDEDTADPAWIGEYAQLTSGGPR